MRSRVAALAVLGAALAAAASVHCTLLTFVGQWQVAPATVDTRLCAMCAGEAGATAIPCAPLDDGGAAEDDGVRVYALRALDFGPGASTDAGAPAAGLDLDCDPRPTGAPTSCVSATGFDGKPWPKLPGSIDNSFGLSLAGLEEDFQVDVESEINVELAAGRWGLLLVVDHWNGSPDDPAVGVRLLPAAAFESVDGGAGPAWDGTDAWRAVGQGWDPGFDGGLVPDTTFKGPGYVTGGVLVWDGRGLVGAELSLLDEGAPQVLSLDSPQLVGPITQQGIHASFGATWPATTVNPSYAFLSGCDAALASAIQSKYSHRPFFVSDLPGTGTDGGAGATCEAVSVGISMTFARAGAILGPLLPFPPLPTCTVASGT